MACARFLPQNMVSVSTRTVVAFLRSPFGSESCYYYEVYVSRMKLATSVRNFQLKLSGISEKDKNRKDNTVLIKREPISKPYLGKDDYVQHNTY